MPYKYVKVYYGPYDSFYTVSHKTLKVRAFRDLLQKSGYRVDLVPVSWRNYFVIEMGGFEIFRCNIKNLSSVADPYDDPVCMRAIQAVEEGSEQLLRASNYFWLWSLIDRQMFCRGPLFCKDTWPFDIHLTPLKLVTLPNQADKAKEKKKTTIQSGVKI